MPILLMVILFLAGIPLIVLGGGAIFVHDKVAQVEDFIGMAADPEAAYQEYLREMALQEAAATWTPLEIAAVIGVVALVLIIGFVGWRLFQNQEGYEY